MPLEAVISLGILGLVLGVSLGIAAKKLAVAVDPREAKIMDILPGANCGACGFPGCQAYGLALIGREAAVSVCPVGGKEVSSKLAEVMGVELEETVPQIAMVRCRGSKDKVGEKFAYQGIEDCLAASLLHGGFKNCVYGCLGLGSCVRACPFGALSMGENGLPLVDERKCTGCGMCIEACPRNIIRLIPREQKVYVACVSGDKGKAVRSICSAGCFGCGLCAKVSSDGAITMDGNLPEINSELLKGRPESESLMDKIGKAVEKCPAKVFVVREIAH